MRREGAQRVRILRRRWKDRGAERLTDHRGQDGAEDACKGKTQGDAKKEENAVEEDGDAGNNAGRRRKWAVEEGDGNQSGWRDGLGMSPYSAKDSRLEAGGREGPEVAEVKRIYVEVGRGKS